MGGEATCGEHTPAKQVIAKITGAVTSGSGQQKKNLGGQSGYLTKGGLVEGYIGKKGGGGIKFEGGEHVSLMHPLRSPSNITRAKAYRIGVRYNSAKKTVSETVGWF